jgi:hypothetical protein
MVTCLVAISNRIGSGSGERNLEGTAAMPLQITGRAMAGLMAA